jgi:hypothetical protein
MRKPLPPSRIEAKKAMYKAVRDGTLVRQSCAICGSCYQIHGHHPDHNKPLDVIWLCTRCHGGLSRLQGAKKQFSVITLFSLLFDDVTVLGEYARDHRTNIACLLQQSIENILAVARKCRQTAQDAQGDANVR